MLSSTELDDLIRAQENLRLQSLRHLEELRIRQDNYRCFRSSALQSDVGQVNGTASASSLSENVVDNCETKTLIDDSRRRYRPVSNVIKSASSQAFDSICNSRDAAVDDSQRHVDVHRSASAVLSDDLHTEKLSASATQAARKKLISGRTQTQPNLNNSSSVETYDRSRLFEPVSIPTEFTDMNGDAKAPQIHSNTVDGYFSSGDMNVANINGSETLQKSDHSLEGTPKSILRHRQIIDRNVHVESKFDHTPTSKVHSHRHRRGLNFSYSDVDDAQLFGRKTKSVNFDVDSKKPTSKSDDLNSEPTTPEDETSIKSLASSFVGDTLPSSERLYYAPDVTGSLQDSAAAEANQTARRVASEGLLLQTGNDRRNAKIVRELESRSQTSLFSSDQPLATNASTNVLQSQMTENSLSKSYLVDNSVRPFSKLLTDRQSGPLLGYDWIAGVVDNENSLDGIPDTYFDDVRTFRQQNRDACVGTTDFLKSYELGRPISPEVLDSKHTCIHGYTVNNRLFTEPVNVDEAGNSICPACTRPRKDPTPESPGFVRVSIPKQVLADSYKVKPHRRCSFDATDSCALSQHCLAGWQTSQSSNIPTATSLDLRHATTNGRQAHMTTMQTATEGRQLADSFNHSSHMLRSHMAPTIHKQSLNAA